MGGGGPPQGFVPRGHQRVGGGIHGRAHGALDGHVALVNGQAGREFGCDGEGGSRSKSSDVNDAIFGNAQVPDAEVIDFNRAFAATKGEQGGLVPVHVMILGVHHGLSAAVDVVAHETLVFCPNDVVPLGHARGGDPRTTRAASITGFPVDVFVADVTRCPAVHRGGVPRQGPRGDVVAVVPNDVVGITVAVHAHPKRDGDVLVVSEGHFVPCGDVVGEFTSGFNADRRF